ncbi:hypothetical protein B0H13DRAFT_1947385 [Mycena leptocephala]|nr:hypothetical protein B0H13DRAFT_1947385 [Mycena leptocephala]
MYKQNTTSNECSDQISAESDWLIGSYGIADQDPKRQSCWHRRGPRHRYAIGLEPYTGLLNIESFIPRPFSRFYPMTSNCSGGHCPKSPNFSRADSRIFWRRFGHPGILDPNLAHHGLFLSSRTLIHPATPISRFPVDRKHVFCPFLYLISTP